ncbi:MAG TPA: AAA family ATPase [Acidimicrobiales bacterium]|nr:AAA family ATPase [Acidimicrobiales bacterium]
MELHAHALGVIDDARVEFGSGFNVLTGETGAGKTLLLGALNLCLGNDGAVTRHAARDELRASAVFVDREGHEVVLAREAGATGRLRSAVNASPSSAEALRALGEGLVVVHGQHDSLALRTRSDVLRILDASAGISSHDLDYVRQRLREARAARDGVGGDLPGRHRELDFIEYQIDELEGASINSATELRDALEELTRLTDLRDGQTALASVVDELDSADDDGILGRLARTIDRLPDGTAYVSAREILLSALVQAREGVRDLASLSDPDSFDPATMAALEGRVQVLQGVARKYGGSLEQALATLDNLRARRGHLREGEATMAALDQEITALEHQELELARQLRSQRETAAYHLSAALATQLPRVALGEATLDFDVRGVDGSEVEILFCANPGQVPGPLSSLASGGELSRVLLALSLETVHEDVVAVFDEVDAGIGGQVAQQIGECLRELGRHQQVLAVTHLASVAAQAQHHFLIEKLSDGARAVTSVRRVTGEERVNEIARMLAGDVMTTESRALAQRLLETAR